MVTKSIIALDVGTRRIGVAKASVQAKLPQPLGAIENNHDILKTIRALCAEHQAEALVVGLPRGLDGQETEQTRLIREFAAQLKGHIDIPLYLQDEAVTSRLAEEELRERKVSYTKEDIDALSATYILRDFLRGYPEVNI